MKRAIRLVMAGLFASAFTALSLFSLSVAEAAPTSVQLIVSNAYPRGDYIYVTGLARADYGAPLPGLQVTISLAGTVKGSTVTDSDGTFWYSIAKPAPGKYQVNAYFAGNSEYRAASGNFTVTVPKASRSDTSLTVSIDPTTAPPGTSVAISGKLVSGKTPVGSAVVQVSSDVGDVDPMVGTASDGSFSVLMALPSGAKVPKSFTVKVSFDGDTYYANSVAQVSGSIAAETPETTPPSSSSSPTDSPSATPTAQSSANVPSPGPTGSEEVEDPASRMVIVSVVFFTVALVALGALVILGIISHDRKRLARDERRGFGTDFGKAWS